MRYEVRAVGLRSRKPKGRISHFHDYTKASKRAQALTEQLGLGYEVQIRDRAEFTTTYIYPTKKRLRSAS